MLFIFTLLCHTIHTIFCGVVSVLETEIAMPSGIITIQRRVLDDTQLGQFEPEKLVKDMRSLSHFEVREEGTIEDCQGALQADFANEYIG
jgi:hypothetical protein